MERSPILWCTLKAALRGKIIAISYKISYIIYNIRNKETNMESNALQIKLQDRESKHTKSLAQDTFEEMGEHQYLPEL